MNVASKKRVASMPETNGCKMPLFDIKNDFKKLYRAYALPSKWGFLYF
jgi:hypothetical protein